MLTIKKSEMHQPAEIIKFCMHHNVPFKKKVEFGFYLPPTMPILAIKCKYKLQEVNVTYDT